MLPERGRGTSTPVSAIRAPRSTLARRLCVWLPFLPRRLPFSTTRRSKLPRLWNELRRLFNDSTGEGVPSWSRGMAIAWCSDAAGEPKEEESEGGGTRGYDSVRGAPIVNAGGLTAADGGVVMLVAALA